MDEILTVATFGRTSPHCRCGLKTDRALGLLISRLLREHRTITGVKARVVRQPYECSFCQEDLHLQKKIDCGIIKITFADVTIKAVSVHNFWGPHHIQLLPAFLES